MNSLFVGEYNFWIFATIMSASAMLPRFLPFILKKFLGPIVKRQWISILFPAAISLYLIFYCYQSYSEVHEYRYRILAGVVTLGAYLTTKNFVAGVLLGTLVYVLGLNGFFPQL